MAFTTICNSSSSTPVHFPNWALASRFKSNATSGYVNVSAEDCLFYLFMPCASCLLNNSSPVPVLLWLNGGPGCSSMKGALTEISPMYLHDVLKQREESLPVLTRNPFGWNANAHLLFVDQPRYVGYSYGSGPRITDSSAAARDLIHFLHSWKALFPEYSRQSLVLATESYGGYYAAAFAAEVIAQQVFKDAGHFTVSLLVGNGCLSRRQPPPSLHPPNPYDLRMSHAYYHRDLCRFLAHADLRASFNVRGNNWKKTFGNWRDETTFCVCSLKQFWDFSDEGFTPLDAYRSALSNGIDVTFYYGEQDTVCSYTEHLPLLNATFPKLVESPFTPILHDDVLHGSVQQVPFGRATLSLLRIINAGHHVAMDDPYGGLFALETTLRAAASGSVSLHADGRNIKSSMPERMWLNQIILVPVLILSSLLRGEGQTLV